MTGQQVPSDSGRLDVEGSVRELSVPESREERVALLRGFGLRVTAQRLAVLEVLRLRSHLSADEIISAIREESGTVSVQTVYDVLHTLTDSGLLRAIEPARSATRYERRVGDNHHHFVCRRCGAVTDVPCVVGHAPCLTAPNLEGFEIDEAEVTFWGTCAGCSAVQKNETTEEA